jgi:MFS family permease
MSGGPEPDDRGGESLPPWWRELSRAHWWVILVAILGWLFDAMDQRLFILARTPAVRDLLPGLPAEWLPTYAGWTTAIFIAGWAVGGLVFGLMGDRWGRVRTMSLTILLYSIFTGLSGLARGWWDFALFRFLAGMGIGGEYAAGVALVAESMPPRARPFALGIVQASSSIGAIFGSALSLGVGPQTPIGQVAGWRALFLFGVIPSLLVVLVRMRVKEPDRWLRVHEAAEPTGPAAPEEPAGGPESPITSTGIRPGDLRAIFASPRLRRCALFGLTLAMIGQIGLWSIGLFTPELVRSSLLDQRRLALEARLGPIPTIGLDLNKLAEAATASPGEARRLAASWKAEADSYVGRGTLLQDVGSFFGALFCTSIAIRFGRRAGFAVAYSLALASIYLTFGFMSRASDVYWMLPILGFCTCSVFGVVVLYLPELFPTALRTTGTGFCNNIARFITATGPLVLGKLTLIFSGLGYATPIRPAALSLSTIYVLGLAVVWFMPETKGHPFPE